MEIVIILLLILCNGLFSMSEIALISARKARLQQWVNEGNRQAAIALELANAPDRFLSTVQIGITLIGILAGVFGGATIAQTLQGYFKDLPALAAYAELLALGVVVLGITYLTIILGELVPKRLALNHPEAIASRVAGPMRVLIRISYPLVQLFSASSWLILKLMGIRPSQEPPITEEEVKVLIDLGTQAGVFIEAEKKIIKSVFRLADREVSMVMTPRREIVWLDSEAPLEENLRKIASSAYSRFPLAQGDLDNVLGVVRAKDVLNYCLQGKEVDLKAMISPPLFLTENLPALRLLERFKKSRPHLALIVDEYGGLQGLVTLHDILESIVGDIPASGQPSEPQIIRRENGTWLVDGLLPVDELKDLLKTGILPGEEEGHYQTLGGFVMMQMGRIPQSAEYVEWQGFRFEVVDMDGKRVDKVLITPPRPSF